MTQCWLRSLSTIVLCLVFCGLLSVDADCQVNRVGGTTPPGKKAVGAIVFVHGITGNSVDTFTADNGSYWPRMLLSDPRPLSSGRTLGSYDIFTLDYETSIGSQYNVRNVSIAVKLWIDNSRLLRDYENIIFVCHSLGGLIIMNVLSELGLESGEYQKIAGIALLGTPAKGSSIADGSTLTTLEAAQAAIKFVLSKLERKTVDLRPVYDNTYLQEVNGKWRNALARRAASRRPALACAHETSETFGHWVVRQELAADFCDAESFPMPLNHL